MAQQPIRLAILDDYQNNATNIFAKVLPELEIESFSDTLDAQNREQRAKLIDRLVDFDIISTMRERTAFPASVLSSLPRLKLLLTTGAANASIDKAACEAQGILVVGTSGRLIPWPKDVPHLLAPSLQATAEQTMALMLGLAKLIPQGAISIAQGGWQVGATTGLAGKTLGLVGLGRIGCMVARMAKIAFGMNIIAWSSSLTQSQADEKAEKMGLGGAGAITVANSKLEVFRQSDFISLHYVLSDRSRHMVSSEEINAMKPTACLINTSRGGLIDEQALHQAVKEGRIRGVGLDVFTTEPLPADSPWRTTKWGQGKAGITVLSPHLGYTEEAVIQGWLEESAQNLLEFLSGKPPSPVIVDGRRK